MSNVVLALGLTLFAGLATGIGSAIAFFAKRTDYRFLSVSTGFSAGVMLYVSFVEILFKGAESLSLAYGDYWGHWINTASFFGGIALIGIIDNLIPAASNPHEIHSEKEMAELHERTNILPRFELSADDTPATATDGVHPHHDRKLMRMGLFTALAIGIHNFPEGLATFLAALQNPSLGIAIAIAIALHNIPEGISVSVPIYYATGKRGKAFLYSLLSGLAEPLGALIAYAAIVAATTGAGQSGNIPPQLMGMLFGGVAGIMVYISLDELLPTSRAYGKGHESIIGLLAGMLVMAISLLMMR
jgi:ZIP family zinc transporter